MSSFPEDFHKASPGIWRARKIAERVFSPLLWRQRLLVWTGAILIGVIAAGFSKVADRAQAAFLILVHASPWWPLAVSPLVFSGVAYATRRWFPSIPGSGIPQAIAAHQLHAEEARNWLLNPRVIVGKILLTAFGLLGGASIGREGPTVQVGASLLLLCSGTKGQNAVRGAERGLILAGAAAGVAAAFNTPLAGIVFAIEEMARGFQRRNSSLVLIAIVLSGAASMSILGNYNYFGTAEAPFSLLTDAGPLVLIGIIGGLCGGGFSWLLAKGGRWLKRAGGGLIGRHPVIFAAFCGLVVAGLGIATQGATYGTGYTLANDVLHGRAEASWLCALAKLAATAVSAVSGLPGGIFSPSLSVGAALGSSLTPLFGATPVQTVILLTMVAYFSGVTQAPITAAIIVLEVTGKTAMPAPLIAVAVLAAGVSRIFGPVSLYHALARDYITLATERTKLPAPANNSAPSATGQKAA